MRAALLALSLVLPAAPMRAQVDDNAAVRAAAHAFDEAQRTGDRATLERMLAPDFLFVRASGRVGDRRDFIEGFTTPGQTLAPFEIVDPMFARVSPDVAIIGGEAWIHGTADGKPFAEHFRYSDTFARRGGQWVAVFTQVTPLPGK